MGGNILGTIIFVLMGTTYFIVSRFTPSVPIPFLSLILIFISLLYLWGYFKIDFQSLSVKIILLVSTVFALILLTYPINLSSDKTNYILGARTAFLGHYNPYITPYSQFKSDVLYPQFKDYIWGRIPYTYSPLFLYINGGLLLISNGDFLTHIWLFKILFTASFVLSVWIFSKIISDPKSLYLFSLNPIILNELVKESHVESLLILLIISGLYLFRRKKVFLAFLSFLSVSLIKIYFVIFIPIFLVAQMKDNGYKIKRTIFLSFAGLIISPLFYLPFWKGIDTFSGINFMLTKYSTPNFLVVLIMPALKSTYTNPYINYAMSGRLLLAVGVILISLHTFKLLRSKIDLGTFVKYLSIIYLIFLFMMVSWFFPHYATVGIALLSVSLSLGAGRITKIFLFFLTFYSSFYYVILR